MSNKLFFTAAAAFAAVTIMLAMVWPQGSGARSPAPFGHPVMPVLQQLPPTAKAINAPGTGAPAPNAPAVNAPALNTPAAAAQ